MDRAVRFLIAVAGSQLDDVPEHLVTGRLTIVATSMEMVGAEWSMLHGGASGVEAVAATWAASHGIECGAVEAAGIFAGPMRNRRMLDLMLDALGQGWAVRLECFPTSVSTSAWELVKLCQGNGISYTVTK